MKKVLMTVVLVVAAGYFSGCVIYEYPTGSRKWGAEEKEYVYIDTYLSIPWEVEYLIEPYVQGYFTPELSRYPHSLYTQDGSEDPYNLPCYVRADFNGDYYDDFAFLFSTDICDGGYWYTETKLLVVLSDGRDYFLSAEINLGEIEREYYDPVEFWAIGLMPAGRHTVSTTYRGETVTESITLDYDGFYLTSLDSDESIYFAEDCELFAIEWSNGTYLAKKKADAKPVLTTRKIEGRE